MLIDSGVAGYVAAGMYKKMEGEHWVWNINLTSCLFACELTSKSACFSFIQLITITKNLCGTICKNTLNNLWPLTLESSWSIV